ncbi:hypothetical protein [Paraburkholderia acidiphila]|uniref:Uncharacterized protein n=1 Tax=Paraburkholderia acidiphila TaxID=2571747 RepID=A0A7Z2G510_9BURK|nr:hypothetical protein [Paraburkholderia acidiphila]QGZ55105.1 hypothetical protein FAZ97_09340 [Paraburkholderia acidiphila]
MPALDKDLSPREAINRTREAMLAQQFEEIDRLTERLEGVALLIQKNQAALLDAADKLAAEALTPVAHMAKVFDALEKAGNIVGSVAKCNFKPTAPGRISVDQPSRKPTTIQPNSINWITVAVAIAAAIISCIFFALIFH